MAIVNSSLHLDLVSGRFRETHFKMTDFRILGVSPRFLCAPIALWMAALMGVYSPSAAGQRTEESNPCGALTSPQGTVFDYRKQHPILADVEFNHFTPRIEQLGRGPTGGATGGELRYVLAKFPNHHRALNALVRLGQREKSTHPQHLTYSIDCYFERALRIAHDDNVVRLLYSQFLAAQGRKDEALKITGFARDLADDDGFTHYNVGLVYFELGEYELALKQAWRAEELKFDRPLLRQQLEKVGKWRDAPPP